MRRLPEGWSRPLELRSVGEIRTFAPDVVRSRSIRAKPPKRRKISECQSNPTSPPNVACSTSIFAAWDGPLSPTRAAWTRPFLPGQRTRPWAATCWQSSPTLPAWPALNWRMQPPLPREQGIPLEVIVTSELDRPEYARNDAARCFHCKDELFTMMEEFRSQRGFDAIAYGVNLDDQGDFRPGQRAAEQHHVAAPLREAGLTKQDIRELARIAGLRVWDKPASACLSSRIEYGREVTREALEHRRTGRRRSARTRLPPGPGPPSRRYCSHRDRPRGVDPRAQSGDGRRVHPHLQSPGIQIRDPRSRRLPLRLHEHPAASRNSDRQALISPPKADFKPPGTACPPL